MAELSRKAYAKIQRVVELIHEELESQIEPSPVLFESNKLPNDISEKAFTDALKCLSGEGLISYDSDTKSTSAFYEYDKQYQDALEVINSVDYFINENKMRDKICKNISQYDNQRKAEARLWHITTFIVQPTLDFNDKYKEIMSKHNFKVRYKMKLIDNKLFVNDYVVHRFNAEWQLSLFQRALKCDNGTYITLEPDKPLNYSKDAPKIIEDVIRKSAILRKTFFKDIDANGFKIYHTITDDMIKDGFCDTTSVDKELERCFGCVAVL